MLNLGFRWFGPLRAGAGRNTFKIPPRYPIPEDVMTKDEITARIRDAEAELAEIRRDLINGPQNDPSPTLTSRRTELQAEIASLKAMLDEA